MVDLLQKKKTLTFNFEQSLGSLALQYHPDELSVNETAKHHTDPTIQGSVTYIAPPGSQTRTMNVRTYCSLLLPVDDSDAASVLTSAGLVGLAVGALSLGGQQVLNVISALKSTLSVGKGVYNSISGIISPKLPFINPSINGDSDTLANILSTLTTALEEGVPCTILYDIDQWSFEDNLPRYIIQSMNVSVNRLFEEDGSVLEFTITLGLINVGDTVIQISPSTGASAG